MSSMTDDQALTAEILKRSLVALEYELPDFSSTSLHSARKLAKSDGCLSKRRNFPNARRRIRESRKVVSACVLHETGRSASAVRVKLLNLMTPTHSDVPGGWSDEGCRDD